MNFLTKIYIFTIINKFTNKIYKTKAALISQQQTQNMDRVKRIWYLSPMRAAKVQASLRIRAVSPEPSLLAHTSGESRGTFRQKARSLAPLNGWACAVKICHDGMLEDTNSLDGAHMVHVPFLSRPIRKGKVRKDRLKKQNEEIGNNTTKDLR